MGPRQNSPYFKYKNGLDPQLMRLGSLTLDYANPRLEEPYDHADILEAESSKLMTIDDREECFILSNTKSGHDFGVGVVELVDLTTKTDSSNASFVAALTGSCHELTNPHKFFREQVLQQDDARFWLESRLTVLNSLQRWFKNQKPPSIWLLTGIYLLDDARTFSTQSKKYSHEAKVSVPIPEPTGIAALMNLTVGAHMAFGHSVDVVAGSRIKGRKVWAARWQKVRTKYSDFDQSTWDVKYWSTHIRLLPEESLGVERGEGQNVLEIALEDDAEMDSESGESELTEGQSNLFDDEIRARFNKELKLLKEKFEED